MLYIIYSFEIGSPLSLYKSFKNLVDPYLKDFMDTLLSKFEGDAHVKDTLHHISDETIDKVFKGTVVLADK